ncbi:hypothetical protein M5K25_016090 [Dendrobium thyrsiflorum]|uniref:CCHC-type domain-containing protein n=1 Tax=Dendrobium thyrsiflorum TaxID=117978 RepID=A0ABD0UYY7_DENTH
MQPSRLREAVASSDLTNGLHPLQSLSSEDHRIPIDSSTSVLSQQYQEPAFSNSDSLADVIKLQRSKGALIISEGKVSPLKRLPCVAGKGKEIDLSGNFKSPNLFKSSGFIPSKALNPEGSSSSKNNCVNGFDDPNAIPTHGSKINADLPSSVHGFVTASNLLDSSSFRSDKGTSAIKQLEGNVIPDSSFFSWNKPKHIKINFNKGKLVLSEDGQAVKLVESSEISNAKRLEFSVVVKVFGKELPPNVVAWELRRQWAKFDQFHFTSLGKGWYLCSFKCLEAFEGVLAGGPWFVNQHIVGLDKWSTDFSPTSMKGLSSPIWIRMPHLPLQCWDEENVALIASMIGEPLMLDGNMFLWGKREFARVCVRLELDKPLPLGVWVDGIAGRFFQKVEYERISTFCFNCGMIGHDKSACTNGRAVDNNQEKVIGNLNATDRGDHEKAYGPWTLVKHKKGRTRFGKVKSSSVLHPDEKVVENGEAVLKSGSINSEVSRGNVSMETAIYSKPSNTTVKNKFEVLGELIGEDNPVNSEELPAEVTEFNNSIVGSGSPDKVLKVVENIEVSRSHDEGKNIKSSSASDFNLSASTDVSDQFNSEVLASNSKKKSDPSKFKLQKELKYLGSINLPSYGRNGIGGARKKEASRYLKEIVRDHGAFFAGLVETKIDSLDKFEFNQMMGNNWDFFIYPSNGLSGGILTCWRSDLVSVSVIQASSQVVVSELDCGVDGIWLIATVYGDNNCYNKEKLWKSLGNPSFGKLPFIVGGDFNCILSQDEKKGGKKFVFKKGALDMLAFMRNFDFHEIQATGPRFTWCNNKKGMVGSEAEVLNKKLRRSLRALFFWSKAKNGELNIHKEKLKLEILQLQEEEATSDSFSELRSSMLRAKIIDLNSTIGRLQTWWNQRAKVNWLKEGDSTKFFHNYASAKHNSNGINGVLDLDGCFVEGKEKVEKIFFDFFSKKWALVECNLNGNGSKGMHFVAWNVLCRPKNKGGRGLMSIVDKCGPLRARLAWNFIKNPDSLAHKIIAANGSDLWKNQNMCIVSTAWKILKVGATHLWPFVRWRISSGEFINTVNDTWLLDRNLSSWPTYVAQMDDSSNLLSGFIINRAWDVEKLKLFFGSELIKFICSIKIYSDQDKMELTNKCSGRSISSLISDSSFTELCEDLVWSKMKKLRLRPRVEFFWWKLRLNVIPTNAFLQQRKLVECSDCPRCNGNLEDVDHISVKCIKIHSILKLLVGWGYLMPTFNDFSECIKCIINLATSNPFIGNLFCTVVFLCWKSRNKLSHGGSDDSSMILATNAFCMTVASFNCNLSLENWNANQLQLSNVSWCPPPPRWIKANVDATISINNKAAIGVVFRDCKGRFLVAFGRSLLHWDIAQVEVLSILAVGDIIKDWMFQADGIIIESDNLNVVRFFIDSINNNLDKEGILNPKDLDFIQNFRQVHFNFSVRECNRLADFCASLALLSDFIWDDISSNKIPPSFLSLLKEECLCN